MPRKVYATEEERIQAIKKYQKEYRMNNKNKAREYHKLYMKANPSYQRVYQKNNKDKIKTYRDTYLSKNNNHEKQKVCMKEWRKNNKSVCLNLSKEWRAKNKKRIAEINKNYSIKNPMTCKVQKLKRRERIKNINEHLSIDLIRTVYLNFNFNCYICKTNKDLSIDHHYPLSKGFALTINNAVLLCRSCNSKKGKHFPEYFYSPEQLTDLQLNYGISKSPIEEKQPSLFEARMPKNLERDNGLFGAMNAA